MILLRNADEVKAEVREITDSPYTLYAVGRLGQGAFPAAREVFSVTYQNGEKELFVGDDSGATGPVTAADYPWPRVTKSYRPGDLFDEDGIRGIVISTTDNGRHGLILSLEQAPKSLRWSADSSWATDLLLGLSDREDGWNNRRRLIERLAEGKLTWEDFPAFEWCESLGPGWYLPAVDELRGLWQLCGEAEGFEKFGNKESYRFSRRISELSESYGGDKLSVWTDSRFWWSSTERKDNVAQIVDFGMPLQSPACECVCVPFRPKPCPNQNLAAVCRGPGGKKREMPVRAVHKFCT